MENYNNYIPKKPNIFKRIFQLIKNIFVKDIKLLAEPTQQPEKQQPVESIIPDTSPSLIQEKLDTNIETNNLYEAFIKNGYILKKQAYIEDISPEEDKKRFFKLYENVRNGKINITQLNAIDLIRVNQMLKNEVNIKLTNAN